MACWLASVRMSHVEPQSFSFRLLGRNLHPFPPPQSLDPFVIDGPTELTEKYYNPTVAVSTVTASQFNHVVDGKSLEVSLGGLGQDLLVQRQTGDSTSQTLVLPLQLLQPLELIGLHPAILRASTVGGYLAHANLRHQLSSPPGSAEYST